jgi:hypothetical protein
MATLTIPDPIYAELSDEAQTAGLTIEELVLQKLQRVAPTPLSRDDRRRALDEMQKAARARANRYPPGFRVDDSRETIYKERLDQQR